MRKLKLFLFVCFLVLFSCHVNAFETDIKSIDETFYLEQDGLIFKNLKYDSSGSGDDSLIGFMGVVNNENDKDLTLKVSINYYNINKEKIVTDIKKYEIPGTVIGYYNLHSTARELVVNPSDIKYYKFSYEVVSSTVSDGDISNNPINDSINSNEYSSYEYIINNYDINMIVKEDNSFDITETITAYFNVPKHGIFRTIPLKNTVNRLDGTTSKNRARITNINVNNEYTTSRENGNLKIKIGSASRTLTGSVTYVINYNYDIGRDSLKDVDELYYNLIGSDWDTIIRNVSFKIIMPKEFDSSKLGFSSGIVGSTENSNVKYQIDGNTITGYYDGILNRNESLTVRLELPDKYFTSTSTIIKLLYSIPALKLLYFIPVLGLLYFIYALFKSLCNKNVVETVEFYPPDGLNSLDVGFIYKGKATNKDVISLLIYLANKGYLKIIETGKKSLFSRHNNFKLVKLKNYDGNNYNERTFFDGLFYLVDEVSSIYWYGDFYKIVTRILFRINKDENRSKIIDNRLSNIKTLIIVVAMIIFAVISILPVLASDDPDLVFSVLFPLIGFSILASSLFGRNFLKNRFFGVIFGLLFGGLPWFFITLPILLKNQNFITMYEIGMAFIIGMLIFCKLFSKRTAYGNEMLGKIKGFKRFLETVEKEKLEAIVLEHPTYFYDILPYTYVLGISNKWIKKFESIKSALPSWYDDSNGFTFNQFGSFISFTLYSSEKSIKSVKFNEHSESRSASSSFDHDFSSGSSSSGGGSSGGGFGGGGGGSW